MAFLTDGSSYEVYLVRLACGKVERTQAKALEVKCLLVAAVTENGWSTEISSLLVVAQRRNDGT